MIQDGSKIYTLVIPGKLPGMNEYILSERRNRYAGAKLKADAQKLIIMAIRHDLRKVHFKRPVSMVYRWYEPNRRRDKSNISGYGRKVIEDSLIKEGVLENDGWKNINGFSDEFYVDVNNPRIEVIMWED